ncbi:hypothetical protein KI387_008728, partial [Taxus chinensis]
MAQILSELDIYARVGANTPLVLMDAPANVIDGGNLTIRFEAIIGSPIVSAICIRKTPHFGAKMNIQSHTFREEDSRKTDQVPDLIVGEEDCNQKCRGKNCKSVLEYKRKFKELSKDFELEKKECHEAWMSLEDTNRQLEKLRNELMRKCMHVGSLAYAVEGQVNELRKLQDKHVREKKLWVSQVYLLSEEFKILKSECAKVLEEVNSYASSFTDISRMTSSVQALVDQHEELKVQCMELKENFIEECKERKQLYNKLLDLKVVDVFADTAPVVVSVLDGYNVYIFAYGQIGTRNTFTMEGIKENRGVNYKTLEELFRLSNETKGQFKYDISVSVLEVYNEHIRDLLAAPPQPGQTVKKLEIKQVAEGLHHVLGLVEAQVHSMSEVWEVLQTGSSARIGGSTNANEHSSRSHCAQMVIHYVMHVFNCFVKHFCLHFEAFQLGIALVYIAFLRFMGDDNDAKNFSYSLEAGGSGRKLTCQGIPRSTRDSHKKFRYSHDGLIIQRNMALFFSGALLKMNTKMFLLLLLVIVPDAMVTSPCKPIDVPFHTLVWKKRWFLVILQELSLLY